MRKEAPTRPCPSVLAVPTVLAVLLSLRAHVVAHFCARVLVLVVSGGGVCMQSNAGSSTGGAMADRQVSSVTTKTVCFVPVLKLPWAPVVCARSSVHHVTASRCMQQPTLSLWQSHACGRAVWQSHAAELPSRHPRGRELPTSVPPARWSAAKGARRSAPETPDPQTPIGEP